MLSIQINTKIIELCTVFRYPRLHKKGNLSTFGLVTTLFVSSHLICLALELNQQVFVYDTRALQNIAKGVMAKVFIIMKLCWLY